MHYRCVRDDDDNNHCINWISIDNSWPFVGTIFAIDSEWPLANGVDEEINKWPFFRVELP